MPSPVDNHSTVDLHAPWWSPQKTKDGHPDSPEVREDEPGRYVERWVVRAEMTEANEQHISNAIRPTLKLATGKRNSSQMTPEMIMNELPYTRIVTLLEMTVEITDKHGDVLRHNKALLESFPKKDTIWVMDQIGALNEEPSVEPTEEDERTASFMQAAADAEGRMASEDATPEAQAIRSFRRHR